jgi:hypothetical protein
MLIKIRLEMAQIHYPSEYDFSATIKLKKCSHKLRICGAYLNPLSDSGELVITDSAERIAVKVTAPVSTLGPETFSAEEDRIAEMLVFALLSQTIKESILALQSQYLKETKTATKKGKKLAVDKGETCLAFCMSYRIRLTKKLARPLRQLALAK